MRQFFSFAFLSAISYLCHRVFDKSKWNTKDTAFKVDKSLPRLLPYAVCQIVRFDWNFWWQKVPKTIRKPFSREQPRLLAERTRKTEPFRTPVPGARSRGRSFSAANGMRKIRLSGIFAVRLKAGRRDSRDSDSMAEPSADGGLKARETGQVCLQTRG